MRRIRSPRQAHNPPVDYTGSWRYERWLVALVAVLALWLRWPWPEPQWMHVDERAFLLFPLGFWSGDLNPHFFNYPTLPLYLVSAVYYLYFLLGSSEPLTHFVAYRYFVDSGDLLAIARGLNSLLAVGTVLACIQLGRRLYSPAAGLVAGLFLAVMPLHVRFSHLASTDVPATLLACLAMLWAVRIVQEGRGSDYLLAGLWVGLAGASKYPAALAGLPVLAAALARKPSIKNKGLWVAGLTAALAFGVASPYVWLDPGSFWKDFSSMGQEHLLGASHTTEETGVMYQLTHNLRYGLGLVGLVTLLAALLVRPRGWRPEEAVLMAGIAGFGALLALAESAFMRYALPLAPLLAVLILRPLPALKGRKILQIAWVVALLIEPTHASLCTRALLSGPDTRTQARTWIERHAPTSCRLLQLPEGAGRIRWLDPVEIYIRETLFVRSYDIERLVQSYRLLSQRPDLPPLHVSWSYPFFQSVREKRGDADLDSIVVVEYDHPLSAVGSRDLYAREEIANQVEWRAAFSPGDLSHTVFDPVDYYFVPIGVWEGVEASGPGIRIGEIAAPLDKKKRPSAQGFFALQIHLLQGNQAAQRGDWTAAFESYEQIIEPDFFLEELLSVGRLYGFYINLGTICSALGQTQQAVYAWQQAAKVRPEQTTPYLNLGRLHAELGQHQQAAFLYLQGLEIGADEPDLLFALGASLLTLQVDEQAVTVLERALDLRPEADTYINLGIAYSRIGELGRARICLTTALNMEPEHPQAAAARQWLEEW